MANAIIGTLRYPGRLLWILNPFEQKLCRHLAHLVYRLTDRCESRCKKCRVRDVVKPYDRDVLRTAQSCISDLPIAPVAEMSLKQKIAVKSRRVASRSRTAGYPNSRDHPVKSMCRHTLDAS